MMTFSTNSFSILKLLRNDTFLFTIRRNLCFQHGTFSYKSSKMKTPESQKWHSYTSHQHLQLINLNQRPTAHFSTTERDKTEIDKRLEKLEQNLNENNSAVEKTVVDPLISDKSASSATARFKEAVINVIPRKKDKLKPNEPHLSRERNFVTALRAMSEFLLKPSDLENLRKTKRRSPFENEPPITVYWRKDVEAKAFEVWGNPEILELEKKRREKEMKNYQDHLFKLKSALRSYNKEHQEIPPPRFQREPTPTPTRSMDASGKVVWTAVVINGANFFMKLAAWAFTGSHSLFAEALHSFADVTNQLILAYGIHKSRQEADMVHPYGYTTMRYVSSLVSGAMIFCVGAGLSFQHGITGLLHPTEIVPLYWAFYILCGSLVTEGGTLVMAVHAIRKGAKENNVSFLQYVLRGSDPSINVVLLEDMAAVIGVGIAMSCMGLTSVTGSHIPDAVGSCLIGGLLAGVSSFIVYTNSVALVGRSIPQTNIIAMNNELEADVMIRAIHDVKGIDMGSGYVRYKAEVDFDGRELTRSYLEKQDISTLHQEMTSLATLEDTENFMLKHGENIVDSLGAEVDRIEQTLKKKYPEIRHCDLEIL